MDYWRRRYLLPQIRSDSKIALVGIGDHPLYWSKEPLESLASVWDPARLAVNVSKYCVYDINSTLVEKARGRGISSAVCDVTKSPLPERFEAIFASDVIEHVENPSQFLSNLRDSLTEKGFIVVTTPNALYWRNFLCGFRNEHPEHLYTFSTEHFDNLAAATGLTISELRSFQAVGVLRPWQRILLPIHSVFARIGRGNSIVGCFRHSLAED